MLNVPRTAWGEDTLSAPLCGRHSDLACNSKQSEYFFDALSRILFVAKGLPTVRYCSPTTDPVYCPQPDGLMPAPDGGVPFRPSHGFSFLSSSPQHTHSRSRILPSLSRDPLLFPHCLIFLSLMTFNPHYNKVSHAHHRKRAANPSKHNPTLHSSNPC